LDFDGALAMHPRRAEPVDDVIGRLARDIGQHQVPGGPDGGILHDGQSAHTGVSLEDLNHVGTQFCRSQNP
jgi:hypothetical protein